MRTARFWGPPAQPAGQPLDFGSSEALGQSAYFALKAQQGPIQKHVPCVPFLLDQDIVLDIPSNQDGKTRAKRIQFQQVEGKLTATLELVSTSHGRWFAATACVVLMDADGRPLAVASTETSLRVEPSEIHSATVTVDLGAVDPAGEGQFAAIGLARGRDWGSFGPSTWARWIPQVTPAPFTTEQLLQAEEVGTWKIALENVEQKLHKETISYGILEDRGSPRNWPPAGLLEPNTQRVIELFAREDHPDAEALGLLCRMIGYAGLKDQTELIRPYLQDERPTVRDSAAIGLGLLSDTAGMARLVEIVGRPDVTLPEKYTAEQRRAWETARLRQRRGHCVDHHRHRGSDPGVGKAGHRGNQARTGCSRKPGHTAPQLAASGGIPYLTEIVAMGDDAESVRGLALEALASNKEAARASFSECLRQGDYSVVDRLSDTKDDYYIPMVRELFFKDDVSEWILYQAADYFWNTDTPESLETMRELFDTDPRPNTTTPRLRLATALAYRGDDRGFDHALNTLRELARPSNFRKTSQSGVKSSVAASGEKKWRMDVYDRAKGLDQRIVEFLRQGLESGDEYTVLAAMRVVEESRQTIESLLPVLKRLTESENAAVAATAAKLVRRL